MKILLSLILLALVLGSCRQAPTQPLEFPWKPYSQKALDDAMAHQRPVVIDFFADWCPLCHELDRNLFSRHDIQAKLAQVTALKMDMTDEDSPQVQQIIQRYNVDGLPTVIFLDTHGVEINNARLIGFITPEEFLRAFVLLNLSTLNTISAKGGDMTSDIPLEKATFAGGCFWCMQPFFDNTKGVKKTTVGYAGGHSANPTYEDVSSGTTGYAEAIQIEFDPKEVSYEKLLDIYWHNIDPTQVNGQFVDKGTQYRSAVFYHNDEQKRIAERSRQALIASGRFNKPIVTQIVAASAFYPAEDYHQKYYSKNSFQYKMYHDNSGRPEYLEKTWGKPRS